MRTKQSFVITSFALAAVLMAVALGLLLHRVSVLSNSRPNVEDSSIEWEEVISTEWDFSARLPKPLERKTTSVETAFGDAPLHSFAGSIGPARFTVAVSEYDPRLASEFTEQERYESSDQETPNLLGGTLVHSAPIRQQGVNGREQIIEVPGKAKIHTRMFLIGNRSYQIQVAHPLDSSLDPATTKLFLDSLIIKYRAKTEIAF